MLDNLHHRLLFEASEMRKDGVDRREIVTLLGQDFGLARGEVRQHIKHSKNTASSPLPHRIKYANFAERSNEL